MTPLLVACQLILPTSVLQLCAEAREYDFGAVCVASSRVALAAEALKGSKVALATVVGFPHGNCLTEVRRLLALCCADILKLALVSHISVKGGRDESSSDTWCDRDRHGD